MIPFNRPFFADEVFAELNHFKGSNDLLKSRAYTSQCIDLLAKHHAGSFVQVQLAGCVLAHETRNVAGRLQLGVLSVAFLATKRVIDFGMANQAVRHLRHGGRRYLVGFLQSPVAGLTGIAGVQVAADFARRLQIGLSIDSRGDDRRHIAHLEVLGVAEERHPRLGRSGNLGVLVAIQANRPFG